MADRRWPPELTICTPETPEMLPPLAMKTLAMRASCPGAVFPFAKLAPMGFPVKATPAAYKVIPKPFLFLVSIDHCIYVLHVCSLIPACLIPSFLGWSPDFSQMIYPQVSQQCVSGILKMSPWYPICILFLLHFGSFSLRFPPEAHLLHQSFQHCTAGPEPW